MIDAIPRPCKGSLCHYLKLQITSRDFIQARPQLTAEQETVKVHSHQECLKCIIDLLIKKTHSIFYQSKVNYNPQYHFVLYFRKIIFGGNFSSQNPSFDVFGTGFCFKVIGTLESQFYPTKIRQGKIKVHLPFPSQTCVPCIYVTFSGLYSITVLKHI